MPKGRGGQCGAQIAFSPDGRYLSLTVGDRQRTARTINQITFDGKGGATPVDGATSDSAFATWRSVPAAPCGCFRTPILPGCFG